MASSNWTADAIPDQTGRTVVVTGSTSGIGKEAARVMAMKNADVVLAVRNTNKGGVIAEDFRKAGAGGKVSVLPLDLSSLASVRAFAAAFQNTGAKLDLLVNNAGVMMCPYSKTEDGFEIQIGTNHLGHFALTGLLLPLLETTEGSRVVMVSSLAHTRGDPDLSDLSWEKRKYSPAQAYCDSKIANLLFAYELARRLDSAGKAVTVTAAHPGWTATDLQRHSAAFSFFNPLLGQGVPKGALPTLRAACDPAAKPGDFFGPTGLGGMRGYPAKVKSNAKSRDPKLAQDLWALSEQLTGVAF